jgi:hypothetical protein
MPMQLPNQQSINSVKFEGRKIVYHLQVEERALFRVRHEYSAKWGNVGRYSC